MPHRFELQPFGDAAVRARLPEGIDATSLLRALRALPNVVDAVVTERHAIVTFSPSRETGEAPGWGSPADEGGDPSPIADAIEASLAAQGSTATPRTIAIPVRYDGEDLRDVATAARASPEEVIALHSGAEYTVAAIGFMPGFAYLRGLHPRLTVPRRTSPRARVPALSVAIAGPYCGVYPFASPGGWNLLGTAVGFTPFDADTGARLAPGDRVRFIRAAGEPQAPR